MHVGVGVGVVVDECVDDLAWLLGRRRVVQIDQRPAVDQSLQDRKVGADARHVDRRGGIWSEINPEHGEIIPFWSELATVAAVTLAVTPAVTPAVTLGVT